MEGGRHRYSEFCYALTLPRLARRMVYLKDFNMTHGIRAAIGERV